MKLAIRNVRGVSKADIEIGPTALIAGPNAAGKTSVAQALAALLTGDPLMIPGMRKSDAGMLVHSGSGAGSITLEHENGKQTISYPAAKVANTEGAPLAASKVAAGIESLSRMDVKERSTFLAGLLQTAPTREELEAELEPLGMEEKRVTSLWEMIESQGWDGAHAQSKERGATLKGQWEEITGERYGSNKSEGWLPEDWDSDLDGASEESLQSALTGAQEAADATVAVEAIASDKRSALEINAARLPELTKRIEELRVEAERQGEEIKNAIEAAKGLPKPSNEQEFLTCPHCEKTVIVQGAELIKYVPADPVENKKRAKAIQEYEKIVADLHTALKKITADTKPAEIELAAAEKAAADIAAMDAEQSEGGGGKQGADVAAIEKARAERLLAEKRLVAFQRKTKADSRNASVGQNQIIVAVLAADGLRLKALRKGLSGLNEALADFSLQAGWAVAEVGEDMSISYGGRPYAICSESEQFRADFLLQVVIARTDGSAAVIIDRADILDKQGRNGLFKALSVCDVPSLVCMTLVDRGETSGRTDAARIGAAMEANGSGAAYWVDQGVVELAQE